MPLNIDWQQILLHLFNFAILFFALYFILYKPVRDFMDKREQMYIDRETDSNKKLEDANKAKAEYEQLLQNAESDASFSDCEKAAYWYKKSAEQQAAADAEAIREQARADAEQIIEKARATAELERNEILKSTRREIAKTAAMMAEKIVTDSDTAAYDRFIESAERGESDA